MKTLEKNKKYVYFKAKRTKKTKITWNGIPAFIKNQDPYFSLYNNFFASILGHIVAISLVTAVSFLLAFWGIHNIIFPKPQQKMPDIEFILSGSAKHKSKRNKSESAGSVQNIVTKNTSPTKEPAITETKQNTKPTKNISKPKKNSNAFAKIPDDFSMPTPNIKPSSSASGGSRRRGGASSNSDTFSPTVGVGIGSGTSQGQNSSGGTGFDKNTTRKLVAAYDISPYVNELKRNIRLNWKHPKNNDSKNVELFLRIAKDGKIIILNVKRTSENGEADNAALNAVRRSEPLSPLPSKYSKGYLDVVFTFDNGISSVRSRY